MTLTELHTELGAILQYQPEYKDHNVSIVVTPEMGDDNLNQVYDQYNAKHGTSYPKEP